MLERIAKPLSQALFLGAGLGMTSLLYIGAFYSHPAWDDFCVGWYSLEYSALDAAYIRYMGVSGKFTAYLWMGYFFEYIGAIEGRTIGPIFILLTSLAASIYLTTSLCPAADKQNRWRYYLAGVMLFATYTIYLRLNSGMFYWITGGFVYQMGIAFWWALLGGLIRVSTTAPKRPWLVMGLLGLWGFFTVGHAETVMVMTVVTISVLTVGIYAAQKPYKHYWGVTLLCVLLGTVMMFISPGNGSRIQKFPDSQNIGNTIRITLQGGYMFLSLGLVAMYTLQKLLPFQTELNEVIRKLQATLSKFPVWVVAMWAFGYLALPFVMFLPLGWSLGTLGPERSKTVFYAVWIVGWLPFYAAIATVSMQNVAGLPAAFDKLVSTVKRQNLVILFTTWLLISGLILAALLFPARQFNVRTLSVPHVIFVLMALSIYPSLAIGNVLLSGKSAIFDQVFRLGRSHVVMLCLTVFFLSFSNFKLFLQDYADGTWTRFDTHIEARYVSIDAALAAGELDLAVPELAISARPELTIMHGDITPRQNDWVNGCTAGYLGLDSIVAIEG